MGLIVNLAATFPAEQTFWGTTFPAAAGSSIIKLFKNDITPGPTTNFGDFVEADFTGYAGVNVVSCDSTHNDPITGAPVLSNTTAIAFNQTGTTVNNIVYGWFSDNGAGVALFAERFDTPINMDSVGKQIKLLFRLFFLGVTGPSAYED